MSGDMDLRFKDFVELSGEFGFQKNELQEEIEIVAQEVTAIMGIGSFNVGLNNGFLALILINDGSKALEASGSLNLQGAGFANASADDVRVIFNNTGRDFSTNNRTVTVSDVSASLAMGSGTLEDPLMGLGVLGLEAELIGLTSFSGDFNFLKGATQSGLSVIKAGVFNFAVFIGDGNTNYVRVSQQGTGGFIITENGLAGQISTSIEIINLAGVAANGLFELKINNTPTEIKETFSFGNESYNIDVRAGPNLLVEGNDVSLTVMDVTLVGKIAFQQTEQTAGDKIVMISASEVGVTAFDGEGSGGTAVDIAGARGVLIITQGGVAGSLQFTSDTEFGAFSAGATLSLEINNTGSSIDVEGPLFGTITMDAGSFVRVVISDLKIVIPGLEIEGDFSFRQASQNESNLEVIAGNNVRVFVGINSGIDPIGIELTEGQALLVREDGLEAGFITGNVSLVGITGLEFTSKMTLRINEFTSTQAETFVLDGETFSFEFQSTEVADSDGDSFIQLVGQDINLSIAGVLALFGKFTITRNNSLLLMGGTGIQAFMGSGPAWDDEGKEDPDAVGVLVSNIDLGLVVFDDGSFAFNGEGDVSFIGLGLSDLSIGALTAEARFGMRLNRSDQTLDVFEIPVFRQDPITLVPGSPTDAPEFRGEMMIAYPEVFELSGMVDINQLPGGRVGIEVDGGLTIFTGGSEAFIINGIADFTIDDQEGFSLKDFRVNEVSLFNQNLNILNGLQNLTNRSLTADLVSPYNGAVININTLNSLGYIDVTFYDVNGEGIDTASVNGDEFIIRDGNGIDITADLGFQAPVLLYDTTYRYSFTGLFHTVSQYSVEFLAGSFTDQAVIANTNIREIEQFVLYDPAISSLSRAPPTASLNGLFGGVVINPDMLNSRRYIDITFSSLGDYSINPQTLTGDELILSGSAVLDGILKPGAPINIYNNTYRYYLIDSNPDNENSLFGEGELEVTFAAGSFESGIGIDAVANLEKTEILTLAKEKSGTAQSDTVMGLGPMVFRNPSVGVEDFGFAEGKLILTIGIHMDAASLNFGNSGEIEQSQSQSDSGITAELQGIFGTFDLGVGLPGDLSISPTGKFSLHVSDLAITVPEVLTAKASGILVQYDPDGNENQELIRIDRAQLDFALFPVSAEISPYQDPNDPTRMIPGLIVRSNGFGLGQAQFLYDQSLGFQSSLTLDDLMIGVTDFEVDFDSGITFEGSIYVASSGADFFSGKARITDRDTADDRNTDGSENTEALRAELTFNDYGRLDALIFQADSINLLVGDILTLTAQDFALDTGAGSDEQMVSFSSLGAIFAIGSMQLTGECRNFAILGNGRFDTLPGFGVFLAVGSASGEDFGYPDWMPIKITVIAIEWEDINDDPLGMIITLDATVIGIEGLDLEFSGVIEGIKIDVQKLLGGSFPIIDIASIGVGVKGELFGGEINAQLIGGILKLDMNGNLIDPSDSTTPVEERIMFMGIEGGFQFASLGFTIKLALSDLGPLGVQLSVSIPGGIVIVPPYGIAINDFVGGVEFFKTLPKIEDPQDLRELDATAEDTPENWLASVKQQVIDQYKAVQDNPDMNGFAAAFSSPMTITGSCKLFDIYVSEKVFNGEVTLKISTDGKMLISGKLNFADNNITISAKLYTDLSNISEGDMTVLFLADIPEDPSEEGPGLLVIDGKLQMGFRDDEGNEIEIPVSDLQPANTDPEMTANLAFPRNGESIDAGVVNQGSGSQYYVDVEFKAGANQNLDYASILDSEGEITLIVNGSPVTVNGTPVPLEMAIDPMTGGLIAIELTSYSGIEELEQKGIKRFRYLITEPDFNWEPGLVEVVFNLETKETEAFHIQGPVAGISNPLDGGRIKFNELEARMFIDVNYSPTKDAILVFSDSSPPPIPELSGAGAVNLSITDFSLLADNIVRYQLSGSVELGEISLVFAAGVYSDSEGYQNAAQSLAFIVDGSTADLTNPINNQTIGLSVLQGMGFIDIEFFPISGALIDIATLIDNQPELELILADGTSLTVNNDPVQISDNLFRYEFTGTPVLGLVQVIFLENSFADLSGFSNVREVETFTIDQPKATLSNLSDGATYLDEDLNEVSYFELELTPTKGSDIDPTSVDASDLIINGADTITIVGVEQVSGTNRFRFSYTGEFSVGTTLPTLTVIFSMAENAWQDTAGNGNGAFSETIKIREAPGSFFISLEGGVALNSAGLLDEPIMENRGYVIFEAKQTDSLPRLEVEFGGTFKMIYLGNIASAAGKFILDPPNLTGEPDPDAVTVREFMTELGVPDALIGPEADLAYLPKLWGVVKLETNLEKLKEIGIDLKVEALLQINTTKTLKTETITLEGIPGDVFAQTSASDSMVDDLDSGSLPSSLQTLFIGNNELHENYELETVISGLLWKVIDTFADPAKPEKEITRQYFIQVADQSSLSGSEQDLQFLIHGETQTFDLQPKTLLVAGYGQAIFRLPAFGNAEKTEPGTEWFRATGAFSLKLSISQIEMFLDGNLVVSPFGQTIFEVRATSAIVANSEGFAGMFKLGAYIELPGAVMSGGFEAYLNTFTSFTDSEGNPADPTVTIPTFMQPVVGMESVVIPLVPMDLNPSYDHTDAGSPILTEDQDGVAKPYFMIAGRADLNLLDDLLTFSGGFRILISPLEIEVQAAVGTTITNPFSGDTLFELNGTAAFGIDQDGVYGHAELYFAGGISSTELVPGFDFSAEFVLDFNTALVSKEIQTFSFDPGTGGKLAVETVSLAPMTLRLAAGGNLSFKATDNTDFEMTGRFEFTVSPTLLEIQALVSVTGGSLVDAGAEGALQLSSSGLAGFLRISVSAGAGDPGSGDSISGTGFEIGFNLALKINTGNEVATINGIDLAANTIILEASGYIQFSLTSIVGFRIEGRVMVAASGNGFDVAVDGMLIAKLGSETILEIDNTYGALRITNSGTEEAPIYLIAGKLSVGISGNDPFNGNGFEFDAMMFLEVNTTGEAVDIDGDSVNDLKAGVYVRIHAEGSLSLQLASQTGFLLDGMFDLEMGTNGLMVAAEAQFQAIVGGQTILEMGATGALLITPAGIASRIELSTGAGADIGGNGFNFDASFILQVNTTGQAVSTIADVTVNLEAGIYLRLAINGTLQFIMASVNSFLMEGDFVLEAGIYGLEVAADTDLKAVVGGV
ncbi:MAG: hypothetical protein MI922_25075, partial [Bacteroidales bacterium]|nr:hypothetical protein [Bacteroidales bacterium]